MTRLLIVSFGILVVMFLNAVGGRIEGYLFPVSTLGQITQIEAVGEVSSRIWGDAERLRNCSFDHLNWYLGTERNQSRADLVFEEGTKVRGDGTFSFGPWLVQLTPDQLLNRSYAVVYHRCHMFWLTQTPFFIAVQ